MNKNKIIEQLPEGWLEQTIELMKFQCCVSIGIWSIIVAIAVIAFDYGLNNIKEIPTVIGGTFLLVSAIVIITELFQMSSIISEPEIMAIKFLLGS